MYASVSVPWITTNPSNASHHLQFRIRSARSYQCYGVALELSSGSFILGDLISPAARPKLSSGKAFAQQAVKVAGRSIALFGRAHPKRPAGVNDRYLVFRLPCRQPVSNSDVNGRSGSAKRGGPSGPPLVAIRDIACRPPEMSGRRTQSPDANRRCADHFHALASMSRSLNFFGSNFGGSVPSLSLILEVPQNPHADREQQHDRQQVDRGENAHHRIGEEEHGRGARRGRSEEHQRDDRNAQNVPRCLRLGEDRQRVFAEIVVVDDRAERKQQDGGGEEILRPAAHVRGRANPASARHRPRFPRRRHRHHPAGS